jgi:dihydroneopterin aldolase
MKPDIIFLDRIRLSARIGTSENERSLRQDLIVSIRLSASLQRPGVSDDLNHSVDYSVVENETRSLAEGGIFTLVESLAEQIAALSLRHANVTAVWVRVEKKVLKSADCVGVEIWREKN